MEGNYLTSGDLAMWDTARTGRNYGYNDGGYCYHRGGRGMAATGIGLGAAGLGIAIFGGMAVAFGLNAASKARYKAAENAAAGNARAIDILAARAIQDDNRASSINLDVTQTLRNLTGATGGSASANSLATAEALALLNGGGAGYGRSGQVCPQPVALYSPAKPCDCCNG